MHCFWKSDEALDAADLQMTFTPASYRHGVQSALEDEPGATVAVWQHRPESRGHVRVKSADPMEKPAIQPDYLADEMDRRVIVDGIRLARRLMRTEPLAPYFAHEALPGDEVRTDAEILDFARGIGTTAFHLAGRAGWDRRPTRKRSWTTGSACTAPRGCGSPTPRSCRPLHRRTRTRRSS